MTPESTGSGARCSALSRARAAAVVVNVALGLLLPLPHAARSAPASVNPALGLVERGALAMRSDPEASKRDAEEALRVLKRRPDPDLRSEEHTSELQSPMYLVCRLLL